MEEREHITLTARKEQIGINLLALEGGQPYIERRLSRFPGESTVSWEGAGASPISNSAVMGDMNNIDGRLQRAYNLNSVGRITSKTCQYIFKTPPVREGIDDEFRADVSRDRTGINAFFTEAESQKMAAGWCWLRADAPELPVDDKGNTVDLTIADYEAIGQRPYWTIHRADEVVDWCFDSDGTLKYLISEGWRYNNTDPMQEATEQKVRILWQPNKVTFYTYDADGTKITGESEANNPPPIVPFVPFGTISPKPIWFDDAEKINRQIMNLTSAGDESCFLQMYGQLILPEGFIDLVKTSQNITYNEAAQHIIGMNNPIEETAEQEGISRYITPNAGDLKIMDDKAAMKQRQLFEWVGYSLSKDSKQVESGEAKQWNFMDVASVLSTEAQLLQEVEGKLVVMTKAIDGNFKEYAPEYNTEFDVTNLVDDLEVAMGVNAMDAPHSVQKASLKSILLQMKEQGHLNATDDAEFEALLADVENMPEPDFQQVLDATSRAVSTDGAA